VARAMTTSSLRVEVSDDGLEVDAQEGTRLTVLFDERRVWSLVPSRDGRRTRDGRFAVAWPIQLKHRLDGVAHVVVEDMEGGTSINCGEQAFGSGQGRLRLVNEEGQPLVLDKANRLSVSFAADEARRKSVLEAVQRTLELLHQHGVDAFLAFGCLLGAVREGRLIDHDNDADVSYISRATHPFDVIRESYALERLFLGCGWGTHRMSGADFKAIPPDQELQDAAVDVFAGFRRGDQLFVMPHVCAPLPAGALVPLATVTLEGRTLPAPADPPALLEATYGPEWRVPDPSFKFAPSRATRRRLSGWMRGERRHMRYWNEFYAMKADAVPTEPSSFARWVSDREPAGRLMDVGSGTGRDAIYFAREGFEVLGCDYAPSAVAYAHGRAQQLGLDGVRFEQLNLYDLRHVLARGARIARLTTPQVAYARFLVHAVSDEGRRNLFLLARATLRGSTGALYLEFRTEPTEHEFGEHFRQFVQADQVVDELAECGFEIEHREEGYGLAVHKHEDPRVARIVARMTR
jgi:SAM-dependent methyltransferase